MITVSAGVFIIKSGSPNNQLFIIEDGAVECSLGSQSFTLQKGDCIGIPEWTLDSYICSYKAIDEVQLVPYSFKDAQELLELLEEHDDLRSLLMLSCHNLIGVVISDTQKTCHQYKEWYEYMQSLHTRYNIFCKMLGISPREGIFPRKPPIRLSTDIVPFWADSYYRSIKRLSAESPSDFDIHMVYGCIHHASVDMRQYLSQTDKLKAATDVFANRICNVNGSDVYDLFTELYLKAASADAELSHLKGIIDEMKEKLTILSPKRSQLLAIKDNIFQHKLTTIDINNPNTPYAEATKEKLEDSVNIILEYSGLDSTLLEDFKAQLELYKSFADKDSSDKEVSTCRKALTGLFNRLYTAIVLRAVKDDSVSEVIKMFINYGYVDQELSGHSVAVKLFHLSEDSAEAPIEQVYTAFQWFKAVYDGKKQPSRNEFDIDYTQHLNSLLKEKQIDKATFNEMKDDSEAKVRYELENMFPTVNKMTYGRILSFCPVLAKDHMIKNVDDSLILPSEVTKYLDRVSSIDYSAFYHEYVFEDRPHNIKEDIYVSIRPDVILMPNVGSRGCLWQEIEGLNRRTPARMMISSIFTEDIYKAFVHMTAEYRWEMCKREMGGRWNDIASHCLTSDFSDYAQFYMKDREISSDIKEKIHETLRRCRNNFKEFFANEYSIYIINEAEGNFKLNKHSRQLLFKHCPFSKNVREALEGNVIYQDMIGRHAIHTKQALTKHAHVESRYMQSGSDVPRELITHKQLLEM